MTALLHDAAKQRVALLIEHGQVVLTLLADMQLQFAGYHLARLVQIGIASQVAVVQQVEGECRTTLQDQGHDCGEGGVAFHSRVLGSLFR